MGPRLTVDASAFRRHVTETAAALPGVIPVVKGNGYGFGRELLASLAVELLPDRPDGLLAVGTVEEVAALTEAARPLVLTPSMGRLPDGLRPDTVLTVGSIHHVEALRSQGWTGDVTLKLASSMRRYGTTDLAALARSCRDAGLGIVAAALHLPLAGDPVDHVAEVERWMPTVDEVLGTDVPLDVSHLPADAVAALRTGGRPVRVRLGTGLWHGSKSFLRLTATVTDVHPVHAGELVGYRQVPAPADGHIVLVDAGTSHGVHPLDGGLSPFHHARVRLALLEPPHMHTSMAFAAEDQPCPEPGDDIDLQRPLVLTHVDAVVWT